MAKSTTKLPGRLRTLLFIAVKYSGSYDPITLPFLDECLYHVEEQFKGDEFFVAQAFLRCLTDNKLTFGYSNIGQRYKEFKDAESK